MSKVWLLGHDLSQQSNHLAEDAARELEAQSGKLIVLHVYQVPSVPLSFSGMQIETSFSHQLDLAEILEKNAAESLEKIVRDLKIKFPQLIVELLVKTGEASDVIVEEAERYHVDRIVVGSHSCGSVERFFLGSTAEKVVKNSPVSVLVVKHSIF